MELAFIGTGTVLLLVGAVIIGSICKTEKIGLALLGMTMIFLAGFFFGIVDIKKDGLLFKTNPPAISSAAPRN